MLAFVSLSANAGEIKGAGARTCGSWLEERKQGHYFEKLSWMQGFISAFNVYVYTEHGGKNPNGIFGATDADSLTAWMDKYCRENPLETVFSGTLVLIDELQSKAK